MERSPDSDLTSTSPRFWCRTLGVLALYESDRADEPIMRAGKPLAVLAYLALAPDGSVERDHIAELLWPPRTSSDPRHALRQALYRLRKATGGADLVVDDGSRLTLRPEVGFDCLRLEELAAEGRLREAVELAEGRFLGDFSISESWEFEEWVEAQRSRFRGLWSSLAVQAVEDLIDKGDAEEAIAVAERLAATRPFDEESILLLMRSLATMGRHAIALSRYAAHVDELASVGEDPSERVLSYVEELERFIRFSASTGSVGLPFVGRIAEWSRIERTWAEATSGSGATILIEGAAGLGKTRLIEELRTRVEAGGRVVLSTKCYEPEQNVPYGAVADALAGLAGLPGLDDLEPAWLSEAARLLPELQDGGGEAPQPWDPESSGASKRRLHQALARCVECVARDKPVLLALDDLHWADPATLEVLHYLALHLHRHRVLIVASYRPAELTPAARALARSLCASAGADLIVLEPFTADEVSDLLAELASFRELELQQAVVAQLHSQSGGNPLFLAELLDALSRDGTLFRDGGRWIWSGETRLSDLPNTIGRLLADRIDRLEPWMRACIECLAVAAGEVPVEVLAHAVGISGPRADLAISILEEERFVKRAGTEGFELIHDEFRRIVYHGIPDHRRALMHGAVGSALIEFGAARRPGGAARLVYHFDQAGDLDRARRYALLAAGEASALEAPAALRSHLEMAAAHSPRPLPPRSEATTQATSGGGWGGRIPLLWGGVLTAGVAAVVFTFLGGDGVEPSSGDIRDFRQGTLFLRPSGALSPTHRVVWAAERGGTTRIEPGAAPAPIDVFSRPVSTDGETHSKLFVVRGGDTVQVTAGRSDDWPGDRSPDGDEVLVHRGARTEAWQYTANLYRLRPTDGRLQRVTDTRYQDVASSWSPTGTRIALRRDSLGTSRVWIVDYDGAGATDVTSRYSLPEGRATPAFSPDGERLAVVVEDAEEAAVQIFVVDLIEERADLLTRFEGVTGIRSPVWSPDGRWLSFIGSGTEGPSLWVTDLDRTTGPLSIADLPQESVPPRTNLRIASWTGPRKTHVVKVTMGSAEIELGRFRGLRQDAIALDPQGDTLSADIRWSVSDPTVATVDPTGFVRGQSIGRTALVASAGGYRADTAALTVSEASLDTLLMEDWAEGIRSGRWRSYGSPSPRVEHGPAVGDHVFFNNGDYNHPSGVYSVEAFDASDAGLTLESRAWLDFTGDHWQYWFLSLVPREPVLLNDVELGGERGMGVGIEGSSPVAALPRWSCGEKSGSWDLSEEDATWLAFAVQLRPDGVFECYRDGELVGRQTTPEETEVSNVHVLLGGSSEGTGIYHGRLVVTRGLKY